MILRTVLSTIAGLSLAFGASMLFTVDQHNDPPRIPPTFQSIQMFTPIGQEFRPGIDKLDRVEVFTEDFDQDSSAGVRLSVLIRQGTIDGPVVARSATLSLPDEFSGVTRFDFPTPVTVAVGSLYVLELRIESGDNWSVSVGANSYPSGRQILRGAPVEDSDLWFRIGRVDAR